MMTSSKQLGSGAIKVNLICAGECTYGIPERVCKRHGCVIDTEYWITCNECKLKRSVLEKFIRAQFIVEPAEQSEVSADDPNFHPPTNHVMTSDIAAKYRAEAQGGGSQPLDDLIRRTAMAIFDESNMTGSYEQQCPPVEAILRKFAATIMKLRAASPETAAQQPGVREAEELARCSKLSAEAAHPMSEPKCNCSANRSFEGANFFCHGSNCAGRKQIEHEAMKNHPYYQAGWQAARAGMVANEDFSDVTIDYDRIDCPNCGAESSGAYRPRGSKTAQFRCFRCLKFVSEATSLRPETSPHKPDCMMRRDWNVCDCGLEAAINAAQEEISNHLCRNGGIGDEDIRKYIREALRPETGQDEIANLSRDLRQERDVQRQAIDALNAALAENEKLRNLLETAIEGYVGEGSFIEDAKRALTRAGEKKA